MHKSSFQIMTRFRELVDKNFAGEKISVLDVGSYGVNGTYKEIFADTAKYAYTGLDVNPGPNVDYVPADPYHWPELPDASFDVIVSGQAFEHIEFPWLIIDEIARVLKKNGLACIVAPSRGQEHKYPVDCWRYYPDGFRALAKWASLEVLDAKTLWGKSGFTDGSDQWGDTFCIFFKPEQPVVKEKRKKPAKKIPLTVNRSNPLQSGKQDSYYGFVRSDVIEAILKYHIPAGHVLEIGCAGGGTGRQLKEKLPVDYYVGIDISPEAAAIAANHLDRVIVANIEETDLASECGLKPEAFDLVLALDVLEHLYNPWDVLVELSSFVRPGGYIVASIPNIQNITIIQDLAEGNWQYQNAGILDATHLRFFTLEASKNMFIGAGLKMTGIEHIFNPPINLDKLKDSGNRYQHGNLIIDNLTRNAVRDLFTYQHIVVAQKPLPEQAGAPAPGDALSGRADHAEHVFKDPAVSGLTSIVILTFNELDVTKECVKSIRNSTPEAHEIIFVDNGSTDGTVKWLRGQVQENSHYRLIENGRNLGFAKGCNQGIEASRGEYIVLLNNDVVTPRGWLTGLLESHRHAPDAGIVGPMTNRISGLQQVSDETYRSVDDLDSYAATFRERYRHRRIPLRRIVGFCMLFKRALAEQIGLLDESFGTGNFEDDDYCLRAELAGYKNYIAGDVFIHHYGSRSFIGNKIDYGASMSGNRSIMDGKWTLSTQSEAGKKLAVLTAVELADDLYRKGHFDQAVETLVNCIKLTPDEFSIYLNLIRMFLENKKFAEAWAVIETIPEAAKSRIKTLEYAGYAREGLGQDDEAAAYADQMLAQNSLYPQGLNLKGVLAFKAGDREKARGFFMQAIEADPGYGEAYANLGVVAWGEEKQEEAFTNLRKGFVLSPAVPDISSLYYSVASALGRFREAGEDFREAARLYGNSKNILFLHIDSLISQEKFSQAILEIENALSIFGLDEGTLQAALAVREKIGPLRISPEKKNTLSFCMIVKNEEKHLVKCLKSIRDVADEIIIVDTGSTDKTKDIATVFGARVFDFPWTGDFSAARNESLKKAAGDWIFILDADETLSPREFPELKSLLRKSAPKPVAYSIMTRNYTRNISVIGWTRNTGVFPEEAGAGWVRSDKVRLFPRDPDILFANPVHEMVEQSIRSKNIPIQQARIIVHHYGKLNTEKELQKGEQYYLMGKLKYESNPNNVSYINELAKQAQVLHKYAEAADLWIRLLSLIENQPESPGYQAMARLSYGEPVPEIYMQLAAAYLMMDRYPEALSAARRGIAAKKRPKEYVHIYAHCESRSGKTGQVHK